MNNQSNPIGRSLGWRALAFIPNLVVLAGLGFLGYWGITHEWKLPIGPADKAEGEVDTSWCEKHNVPEAECIECHEELAPRGKPFGFCKEHGVHECTWCRPELSQASKPTAMTDDDRRRIKSAMDFRPRPANHSRDKLHERRIQFATTEAYERAGIEVAPVWRSPMAEFATVHGELHHDPTRVAHVSARVPGTVWRVLKHLGDTVKAGELLAIVDCAAVGNAKSDYLQWHVQLDARKKNLDRLQSAGVPEPTIAAAEAAWREAKVRTASARQALINLGLMFGTDEFAGATDDRIAAKLQFLGLPEFTASLLEDAAGSNNLLPVRAPMPGTITSRDVVPGEVVDSTKMLFEVVDHSRVWLTVGLRGDDVAKVTPGVSRIVFEPDGLGAEITGVISWISTEADHKTRTVRARAVVENPNGRLKANTFGHGRVILREESAAVVVPRESVHHEGGNTYLFIRDRNFLKSDIKYFHVRTVRIGAVDEKFAEVIAGAVPGELVAAQGSSFLMAELLRSKIGEG